MSRRFRVAIVAAGFSVAAGLASASGASAAEVTDRRLNATAPAPGAADTWGGFDVCAGRSDWAFLDQRKQAGDYAFQRATEHSEAMLQAVDSGSVTDPCMRSLAPDLSLAPLLEP